MGIRRQVYLEESDNRLLEEQSRTSGLSVSELIRRAIHRCYGAERQLTWEEVFAGAVAPNTAERDPWVYDTLFDGEFIDEILAEVDRQQGERAERDE